ncbi:MAG: DEAD/DEAH box helicase [Halieaceae bacterium]
MGSGALLRPGSRLGVYPQRLETELSPLERIVGELLNRVGRIGSWRRYRLADVVRRINQADAGLEEMDDASLKQKLEELRYSLLRDGIKPDLVYSTFALIRQYAKRVLGMTYYDVQLFGGWVIVNGNMAEMATGEGKTFTCTLAAATAALAGVPVHVITTNEYLALRDAEEMGRLYEALGLSVAVVLETMSTSKKREAYLADIVYCTNKQIAFDYLRDRLMSRNQSGRLSLQFGDAYQSDQLVLRGLCFAILDEADSVLIDEARTPLILSRMHEDEERRSVYEQALEFAEAMEEGRHFRLDHREQSLCLTDEARDWLSNQGAALEGVWCGARHREQLIRQALSALHFFEKDYHYLVRNAKVEIIDRSTGRVMADRSWQQGLHQLVELKEGCPMTGQRETLASIAYQRFFRRYLRLAGMSGTLQQVRGEMRSVYGQHVIPVPRHRPCLRRDLGCVLHGRSQDKWLAVFKLILEMHKTGQPVLVGTCSVRDSELLGKLLNRRKLAYRILNARQDKEEAEIVATAGQHGQITLATNMAGRGTDIKLGPGVEELGGLHVICTECNEEHRVDQQLYGRSARQGNPGSYQRVLSLNDLIIQNTYPSWLLRLLGRYTIGGRSLPDRLARCLIWLPQRICNKRYRLQRREVARMDESLGKTLAYSGRGE